MKTKIQLVQQGFQMFTTVMETEDEAYEQVTDFIKERYPWATTKYHLEESLDYFLEAYEIELIASTI